MSGRVGSITTDIVADGLVFNFDAANRASYVEFASTSYNTIDSSDYGTLINDPTGSLGSPKAWDFDGVDDRITVTNSLPNLSTLTIELFLKTSTMDGTQNIFLDQNDSLRFQISSNKFGIHLGHGSGWHFHTDVGDTTLSSDTWYQTVWTWNGSISALYLNGVLDGSFAHAAATSGTGVIALGQFAGSDGYNWDGNIANVHIYNRGLTANEVLHNYNALKGRFGL